jgi:hypothetical protein
MCLTASLSQPVAIPQQNPKKIVIMGQTYILRKKCKDKENATRRSDG